MILVYKLSKYRYTPPYGNLLYLPLRDMSLSSKSIDSYHRTLAVTDCSLNGKGWTFNGTSSLINTGSDFIGTTACTIMGWIYPTGWGEGGIAGHIIGNGKCALLITSADAGGGLLNNARLYSDGVNKALSAANSIILNKWNHITGTRTADGTANIYINGVLSGTANQASGTPEVGANNIIVGNILAGDKTFAGTIDDLLVFNRVLSVQEIQAHYIATKGWH